MPHTPIHIIGGGLAGSEAAWQIAGAGLPVVLHEMRPVRMTEAHKTDGLAELVCSNSLPLRRCRHQRGGPAARGDAPRRLADHERGRRPQAARRRRAGGGPRPFLGRRSRARLDEHPLRHHRPRRGRRPAAGRLGQRHHRHRAAHLAGAGGRHPAAHRRDRARLLRRHRADRASGVDRPRHHLAPVALRQGGARRHRRRLHQLPDDARPNTRPSSTRCWPPRRPRSRSGRPPRPTSTAACPSR